MNNLTEESPHPCYWCDSEMHHKIQNWFVTSSGNTSKCSAWHFFQCSKQECGVKSQEKETKEEAIVAWNSLASRLKPEAKKKTLKRYVNVFLEKGEELLSVPYSDRALAEISARHAIYKLIDTVEVEITFTDYRS